jgi:hypothetical protein
LICIPRTCALSRYNSDASFPLFLGDDYDEDEDEDNLEDDLHRYRPGTSAPTDPPEPEVNKQYKGETFSEENKAEAKEYDTNDITGKHDNKDGTDDVRGRYGETGDEFVKYETGVEGKYTETDDVSGKYTKTDDDDNKNGQTGPDVDYVEEYIDDLMEMESDGSAGDSYTGNSQSKGDQSEGLGTDGGKDTVIVTQHKGSKGDAGDGAPAPGTESTPRQKEIAEKVSKVMQKSGAAGSRPISRSSALWVLAAVAYVCRLVC